MHNIGKKINLKANEEIRAVIRRSLWHWWIAIVLGCILFLLPFFLIFPLFQFGWWGVLVFIVLISLGLLLILRVYLNYRQNIFVMTNIRIVDIDYRGLFSRVVSSTIYSKIQDVTYKAKGVLASFLGLGDITISFTGSQKTRLKLPSIKHPEKIVSEILMNQEEYTTTHKKSQAEIILGKIKIKLGPDAFAKLMSNIK